MSDAEDDEPQKAAKPSKMPLILGLVLAIVGAGGGFFATSTGLIPLGGDKAGGAHAGAAKGAAHGADDAYATPAALPDIAYVPMEPITIAVATDNGMMHLRFRAEIEVNAPYKEDVQHILPRIVDVLNGYLRALEFADFRDPAALARLRAQMLRRIQIVTGQGRVRDLLIMDFVLS